MVALTCNRREQICFYINRIKERGVTIEELAKHAQRIDLLTYDLWVRFSAHAKPEGFRAQIVAVDREAIILYKRSLNKWIARSLEKQGFEPEKAREWAAQMSVCIYSSNQEDGKPSEDPYLDALRHDLRRYALEGTAEKAAIAKFTGDNAEYEEKVQQEKVPPVYFLIVCNKLLTGFDAPHESVLYLDSQLREHNLLQAIARTNRVYGSHKEFGLIVDYIGVTKRITEALASYRQADIQNALLDLDGVRADLKAAHAAVLPYLKAIPRHAGNLRQEYNALIAALGTEDQWFTFQRKAKAFIKAYDSLSPDPTVLDYTTDMKWVAGFLPLATLRFEKKESSLPRDVSAKIRAMLEEHLSITGISTLCKLRNITDPEFWHDFTLLQEPQDPKELKTAAVRKSAELQKIMRQKMDDNEIRYGPFSDRVLEVLRQFEQGQLEAIETLRQYDQILRDLQAGEQAYRNSGLNQQAYGILKILEAFQPSPATPSPASGRVKKAIDPTHQYKTGSEAELDPLQHAAQAIDALYSSNDIAPPGWHRKDQLRKELRQQVRAIVFNLGLVNWKEIPSKVDEYALKQYLKG